MKANSIIITGGSGGVGTAVKKIFYDNSYNVISIDKKVDDEFCHKMIEFDIAELAIKNNSDSFSRLHEELYPILEKAPLKGFVHNAGLQVVKPMIEVTLQDIQSSLQVNMLSSLVISQMLYPHLKINQGSIVNVGSIHATQSKPGFGAYSISKTALAGLTKALALEWGSEVPVNSIDPAAIDTKMLRAGFQNDEALIDKLSACHPTKSIASTVEVAKLIYFLIDSRISFMNGAAIRIDGGISKLLHDPDQ